MSSSGRVLGILPIVLVLAASGCARRMTTLPVTTPAAAIAPRNEGKVAYTFLVDPGSAAPARPTGKS